MSGILEMIEIILSSEQDNKKQEPSDHMCARVPREQCSKLLFISGGINYFLEK